LRSRIVYAASSEGSPWCFGELCGWLLYYWTWIYRLRLDEAIRRAGIWVAGVLSYIDSSRTKPAGVPKSSIIGPSLENAKGRNVGINFVINNSRRVAMYMEHQCEGGIENLSCACPRVVAAFVHSNVNDRRGQVASPKTYASEGEIGWPCEWDWAMSSLWMVRRAVAPGSGRVKAGSLSSYQSLISLISSFTSSWMLDVYCWTQAENGSEVEE
jgi:hypothetical protein